MAGFVPAGNYTLDEWGPRRRGEWPGPKIAMTIPEWKFPKDYSLQHIKSLQKLYWRRVKYLQHEVEPQLPEDQKSRVLAEDDNARRQREFFTEGFEFCREWVEAVEKSSDHMHYRDFCWKLCVVYIASSDDERLKKMLGGSLYDYLDSICFKGEQTWAFCDSFLAKAIHCSPEDTQDLPGLIDYHRKLCRKVTDLWCPRCEPLSAEECRKRDLLCTEWRPEDYLVLPIFQRLFIIMDEIPYEGPPHYKTHFHKAKARLVFTDPINVPDVCAKYSNISSTDNPNVVIGEFGALVEVVMSLWEEERPQLTYLDPIVDKLQERMKFKVQDDEIARQRLDARPANCAAGAV